MFNEERANLFDVMEGRADAIVITTNGFVRNDGTCVMGAGIAKELVNRSHDAPKLLGALIKEKGNHVHNFTTLQGIEVVSFPVKPTMMECQNPRTDVVEHMQDKFNPGDNIPGWACVADLGLIEQSLQELIKLADRNNWQNVLMPRVGCGFGELSYDRVKPLLEKYLDGRFTVFEFETPYTKGGNRAPAASKPQWGQQQQSSQPQPKPEYKEPPLEIDMEIPF